MKKGNILTVGVIALLALNACGDGSEDTKTESENKPNSEMQSENTTGETSNEKEVENNDPVETESSDLSAGKTTEKVKGIVTLDGYYAPADERGYVDITVILEKTSKSPSWAQAMCVTKEDAKKIKKGDVVLFEIFWETTPIGVEVAHLKSYEVLPDDTPLDVSEDYKKEIEALLAE